MSYFFNRLRVPFRKTKVIIFLSLFTIISLISATFNIGRVNAAALLTATPVTWNVIGLDSNNVNVGPNHFPVGARVCNAGDAPATNVSATFMWDTANALINIRPGTNTVLTLSSLSNVSPNNCADFYFEVEVTRNASAYNTTRQYHIAVTADGGLSTSTPTPRELFAEHLISQSRNAVSDVQLDGVSIPAGGTMALAVGNTYSIKLIGFTATQGYNQLESFINFPNTIFQILSVTSTYTAGASPTDKLYADACGWDNVPTSPTYRSCIVSDNKSGGDVTVTYVVKILAVGSTNPQPLSTLLYDFSGSSYHYNSDYGVSARYAYIIDPSAVGISKSFSPASTVPGGTSTLTFTLTNSAPVAISGINFTDPLPLLSGGQMVVATPATYSTSGCGSPTFAPIAGALSVSFSNGTIAANSSCTISVSVKVPSTPTTGTYNNVSNNVFVNDLDSGNFATADLTLGSSSAGSGLCGLTMAEWTLAGFTVNPPPQPSPSTQSSNVATAAVSVGNGLTDEADTTASGGNPQPGILTYGWPKLGPINTSTYAYIQFAIDTSAYTGVTLQFDAQRKANGPDSDAVYFSTDGSTWTLKSAFSSTTSWVTYGAYDFTGQTNTTGVTYFRIYGYGANTTSKGADLSLDNIKFSGCGSPEQPTLTKAFSPNPVVVGGTSTLTFTITNPNSVTLNGLQFNDSLPSGLTVATTGPTSVCGGSLSTTAPSTISFSGGILTGSSSCTISTTVSATTSGPHTNISGFIASTEGGTNSTSSGSASASLSALLPPEISKYFNPNPILAGGTSTLTFIITNPNPSDALPSVAFTDTFPNTGSGAPGDMLVANPTGASTSGCGAPTFTPGIGAASISFSNGTIAAGGTCTVTVNVTAPTLGDYPNTSGAVTTTISGVTSGTDTASSTLTVTSPTPGISLVKQVSSSPTGPWSYYLSTPEGNDVYYRFILENIGDVALTSPSVTDIDPTVQALLAACSWASPLPVASPSADPTETCIVGALSAVAGDHPNTATGTGSYGGSDYSDEASALYVGVAPPLVTKSFSPNPILAGASSTMTITIENPAENTVALTGVNFSDSLPAGLEVANPDNASNTCGGTLTAVPGATSVSLSGVTLGVGATCTVSVDIMSATIGDHLNSVTVNAANSNASLPASDTLTANPGSTPAFTITKDADVASVDSAGDLITYTITVVNTGSDPLTSVSVSDSMLADLDCDGIAGAPYVTSGFSLALGESLICNGTYTVTQSDMDSNGGGDGFIENTVTGSTAETQSKEASESVAIVQNPELGILKSVTSSGPYNVDDTITYDIVVTNTGTITLTGVSVTDAGAGVTLGPCTWPGLTGTLAPSESVTCTASHVVTVDDLSAGSFSNTAIGDSNETPSNSSIATVPFVSADLSLTKTVDPLTALYGAEVTFTITVTNSGPDSASGVQVTDFLPSGYSYVSHVASQGAYADSSGLWDIGALTLNQSVTLDITATVLVQGSYANTAEVSAANEFDPDSTPDNQNPDEDDQASASVNPTQNDPDNLSKTVSTSDQDFTTGLTNMAIGEIVTYQLSLTVPPGVFAASTLQDTLSRGLAFVDCVSVDATGLSTDAAGGFDAVCSGATPEIYPGGSLDPVDIDRRVTFDFGTLSNTNLTERTLTVTYRVSVLDSDGNQDGVSLANSAIFDWGGGALGPASALITVVEPDLGISKSANTSFVTLGSEVTFTLRVAHTASSTTEAFDVVVLDVLPAQLTYVSDSLDCTSGAQDPDVDCSFDGVSTVRAEWSEFTRAEGQGVIRFRARVNSIGGGVQITNSASLIWTSLPGASQTISANPYSHERAFDPPSNVDVYGAVDEVTLLFVGAKNNPAIPSTGFAPAVFTPLRGKPATYNSTGGLSLEIPKLKLKLPIVGVPLSNGIWDVNWLTGQVGWLEETAFPGFAGNSVITSHVATSYGVDGPFAKLKNLSIGDHILLRSNGQILTYEVREMRTVLPNDMSVFQHEEASWLTLITCADFNPLTQTYNKRLMMRAILIQTETAP